MQELKRGVERTERLAEIRQVFVRAAEAAVLEAEAAVLHCREAVEDNARLIEAVRKEIAYSTVASAASIQNREHYMHRLKTGAVELELALEKAKRFAEARKTELREAMREQKVIDKVQERRLHEWRRLLGSQAQKDADEMSVGRFVRVQSQGD